MSRDPYLSIRYKKLKITIKQVLKKCLEDCDYTLDDLVDLCHDHIPEDKRNTIDSVEKLVDALEEKGVLSTNDVSMVKVLAEELELETLKEKIEKYEWKHILGFSGKASKVVAQTPEKCWGALTGAKKEAVIILKTFLTTAVQAGAVCTAAVAGSVVAVYINSREMLQTSFRDILPYAMNLVGLQKGSLYFMLETSSLSSLKQLWTSYKDGSLEKKLKKIINEIDEVRQLTQGTEIDVTVEIDEDEYREACWVLVLAKSHEFQDAIEKESSKGVQRLCQRRHSLSCGRDLLPRNKTHLYWQEWRALMEVESKLENETRRRMCVEKQNEELGREIEVLKGIKDTAKAKKEFKMALREKNEESMIEKTVDKLKKTIEYEEEMLKNAVDENNPIDVGSTYTKISVLYSTLGNLYMEMNEKENCEHTMKKAESYFRKAADSWKKLNTQLNNEDENSVIDQFWSITNQFLSIVLLPTKQTVTEEALIVYDYKGDRDLVHKKKFQMIRKKFQSNQ